MSNLLIKCKATYLLLFITFLYSFSILLNNSFAVANNKFEDNSLTQKVNPLENYIAVTNYEDGFLAVSENGKIDWINREGKITKTENFQGIELNCVFTIDKGIVVAGVHGTMLVSSDKGTFKKIDSDTNNEINSLTFFKEYIIAGANNGQILIGDKNWKFKTIQLELKGNIVSVSSKNDACYGVTNEGEIIHTNDGVNWKIFDFNKTYNGFYKTCYFNKILATKNQLAVIGIKEDGSPVLLFSARGTVWTERSLNYDDNQGMPANLTDIPNDIYYDIIKDRFILACSNGNVMVVPPCSHCNKLYNISTENFKGISGSNNKIIIVGENGYLKTYTTEYF